MKLKRVLAGGEVGRDVLAIKRGLNQVAPNFFPRPTNGFNKTYNQHTIDGVRRFQRRKHLHVDGKVGQTTLDALWPHHMDAYARFMYRRFRPPPTKTKEDVIWERLLASMERLDRETPGYVFGGQHGIPLKYFRYDRGSDCSSSTSKALWDAGIFPYDEALVSGLFYRWGEPGPGKYFTVYYNPEHVWMRLHKSNWWRFDTSPHGDGGRGPQLRRLPRFSSSFATRHWPGM